MRVQTKNRPPARVPISERALFQRINRKLKQNEEELRKARSAKQAEELGEYYTVYSGTAEPQKAVSYGVCLVHVDLEKLGRKLGVLRGWEELSA